MTDKTLVERLDILIKDDHERGCQGRYFFCTCGYDNDCSQAMQDAKSRIEALEARLEIEPSHPYDGIYARDETIRLLEQRIEALEIEKRKLALDLLAALGQAADALEGE